MSLGNIIYNFNLIVDGRGQIGRVEDFKPPKVSVKMGDFENAGLAASLKIPMGQLEELECEFTLTDYSADVLSLFQILPGKKVKLTARGSRTDDTGSKSSVVLNMQGYLEVDREAWKVGEKAPLKIKMMLHYYREEIAGRVIYDVDPVNLKCIVGGVDQLADTRSALAV